jgi:hypothetical protein
LSHPTLREPVSRSRWIMRGLLLFALAFANLHDIWSPDVLPNALLPFTLLREGNVDYDEFVFRPADRAAAQGRLGPIDLTQKLDSEAYFFRACGRSTATEPPGVPRSKGGPPAPGPNDHVCSVFPPGMGLLATPFFLPFVITGANALDLGLLIRVGHVAAAFYDAVAALLLWAVIRRYASERAALGLVLLYWLGTSVRTVSAQALWQHAGVHLAVASALWLLVQERWLPRRSEFLAGLALGLGSVVRQTTAIAALAIPSTRSPGGYAVAIGGGMLLGIIPLLAFNALAYGSPVEQGYGVKPFDTPVLEGLYGLLLSPSRGLFIYEPWAVLALGSFGIARFANTTRGRISERIAGLVVPWSVALAAYATYAEWWGGRVFGPRFLDDFAPLLIVGLAWGVRGGWFAFGFMRGIFWLAVSWSLLLFNAAAFVYDQNTWDLQPTNINDDPSRLFSWSDPQWLAVLRALPDGGVRVIVALGLTLLILLFLARVEGLIGRKGTVLASALP